MMKVAMIGCGGIGEYHLSHLTTFGDIAQLAGFCDLILERAEKFAQETGGGAMAYTDFRVMLTEVKPDAVFVCVPPYCHGEIEEELINRNIDFFVEKPLTLDMELAKSIEKRVAEKGLVTAVGFQCRYDMLAEHIKEFARQNPIPFVDCTRFGSIPEVFWWKDKKLSGGEDIGYVGEVKEVDTTLLHTLLKDDFLPVICPIGYDDNFHAYNINADDAACAEKLAFLTDIEGVYRDYNDKSSLISELSTDEARELLAGGTIGGGMLPKLNNCIDAIEHGVSRVHILDGRIPHCLLLEIFTNKGIGTAILSNEAERFYDTNI